MADIITRLKFETDEFHNRARRASTEINQISQQMEKAGVSVDHMNAKNLKLAQSFGQMQTVSTTLRGKVSELSEAFVAWGHHYNMLTAQQKRSPYGQAVVQQLDVLRVRIQQTKAEISGLEGKLNGGAFGSKFMQNMMPGLSMGVGAFGGMMAARGAQAVVGFAKDTVRDGIQTNMEFEQSNANLAAVLGKTTGEIVKLTENAKSLGATTIYTANQITELQTVLARRGFGEEQILRMTHGISSLAVATGTDLEQAAGLAGSAMQMFGMKASQMDRITAALGVSTTKSALTMADLQTSLQYVGNDARVAGLSIEDTIALLGTLENSGIGASMAGTSLRQILLQMTTSNGKLAKSLGHPIKSLDDLKKALDMVADSGDEGVKKMSENVRITARSAFLALVNNRDAITKLRDEITDVEEELENMRRKQMETLKGSVTILNSAWDSLMLSFSSSTGTIKKLTDTLGSFIQTLARFSNRGNGGDSSIATYAWNEDEKIEHLKDAKKEYEDLLKNGKTDDAIRADYEAQIAAVKEGQKKLREEYDKNLADGKYDSKWRGQLMKVIGTVAGPQAQVGGALFGKFLNSVASIKSREDIERELAKMDNDLFYLSAIRDMASPDAKTVGSNSDADENGYYAKILEEIKKNQQKALHGDPHAEEANRIKAEYTGYISELDREAMTEREYTEKVYQLYNSMFMELEALYSDDLKRQYAYTTQKNLKHTQAVRDMYKIGIKEQKAAIELEAKNEIEALKKNEMGEREYADKVYKIRKEMFEKLITLYATSNPTKAAEYAAQLATHNSNYQGSQPATAGKVYADYSTGIEDSQKYLAQYIMMAQNAKDANQEAWATGQVIKYAKEVANASTQMQKLSNFKTQMGEWQNAFSGIISGVDSLTNVIETMQSAIEGNASAWDVLKSIINSTFGIMNSVVTVMETINTLTEVGRALSEKKAAANALEASTAGAAAGGEAGKSVASIPIVGPVLAVAAIGAVAAAVASMFKKTEYHADGGFVGGGPRGTDTVNTWLTPGELVLNRAQQTNLAAQLQPAQMGYGDIQQSQSYVSGEQIWLGVNNYLRRTGRGEIVTSRR